MKATISLLTLLSLSGCVGLYDDVSLLVDKSRCRLRVGILTDVRFAASQADRPFLRALRYFAEREVDAVVIAGDVTRDGNLAQRRELAKAVEKLFPRGGRVKLIAVTGETGNPRVYEELTGRSYSPVFTAEVRGYAFIGANWKDALGVDTWALKPLLAKVDRSKPFFYVQNLVPYATCCPYVGRPETYDSGKVTYMLSKFPNAVAICGRAQTPLTDESAFWHGDFTCVNAGSFSRARMRGPDGLVRNGVRHGLVMSVYDSSIVFERFDFMREKKDPGLAGIQFEKLGPDWSVSLPAVPAKRPETAAPQFWDDTRLMILPSEKNVIIRFPPVLAKHTGVRAYAYEVRWFGRVEGPEGTKTFWSPGFCASEDNETVPVSLVFRREALPKGNVRFEVTPVDAFGQCGRPLVGEVVL